MIELRLLKVFNRIFSTTFQKCVVKRSDLPEWDSMKHAQLIIEIQKEFKISLEVGDVIDVENLIEILEAISKKKPNHS